MTNLDLDPEQLASSIVNAIGIVAESLAARIASLEAQTKTLARQLAEAESALAVVTAQKSVTGVRWAGVFDGAREYRQGELATAKGSLWLATQDHPPGDPQKPSPVGCWSANEAAMTTDDDIARALRCAEAAFDDRVDDLLRRFSTLSLECGESVEALDAALAELEGWRADARGEMVRRLRTQWLSNSDHAPNLPDGL